MHEKETLSYIDMKNNKILKTTLRGIWYFGGTVQVMPIFLILSKGVGFKNAS